MQVGVLDIALQGIVGMVTLLCHLRRTVRCGDLVISKTYKKHLHNVKGEKEDERMKETTNIEIKMRKKMVVILTTNLVK